MSRKMSERNNSNNILHEPKDIIIPQNSFKNNYSEPEKITKKTIFSKIRTVALCSLLTLPLITPLPAKLFNKDINTYNESQKRYQNNVAGINNFSIGDLERKLFSEEYGVGNFIKGKEKLDLDDYFSQFSNVTELETTWKIKHAKKVFEKYGDSLKQITDVYGVPLNFFLAKLGVEGAKENAISKTGRKGFSQIYDKSTIEVLLYIGKNEIKGGKLYDKYLEYTKEKNPKNKVKIINDIIDNPVENLEVGVAYCKYLKDVFGDWSLASAAYQLGPTKMSQILHYHKGITTKQWWPQLYHEKKTQKGTLKDFFPDRVRNYVVENNLTIADLINNEALMLNFHNKLKTSKYEQPETYAPWVMKCAAELVEYIVSQG